MTHAYSGDIRADWMGELSDGWEAMCLNGVIDQGMDAISKSIPLLKKRRESVIFDAVMGKYPEMFVDDQGSAVNPYVNDSRGDWMGELPKGWQATRLPMVVSMSNRGVVVPKEYWNIGNNVLYTCARDSMMTKFSDFDVNILTNKSDLLLACMANPYVFIPDINSIYSNVVCRVRVFDGFSRRFIAYGLMTASRFIKRHGVVMDSFNFQRWSQLVFPLPPRAVQDIIASYLDREVRVIDQQMDAISKSIPLLKKRRESVIFEAVTGKYPELFVGDQGSAVNPYANDSRGDWMGELPKGWQATRLPLVINAYNVGIRVPIVDRLLGNDVFYTCSKDPFYLDLSKYTLSPDFFTNSADVLLSAMANPYVNIPNVGASYSHHVYRITLSSNVVRNYISYALTASSRFIKRHGVTMDSLNFQRWSQLVFPLPNRETQESIAAFLDKECGKIDCTIGAYEKMYELLKKRRESLIYEAVTGKIPLDLMK